MADLTITVGSVLPVATGVLATDPIQGIADVDLTQFQPVYADATTGKYKLCDATTTLKAGCTAITVNAAKAGQPISVLRQGDCNPGATLVVGKQYVVSANLGRICPIDDLISGNIITYLFIADTASNARFNIYASGIAKA